MRVLRILPLAWSFASGVVLSLALCSDSGNAQSTQETQPQGQETSTPQASDSSMTRKTKKKRVRRRVRRKPPPPGFFERTAKFLNPSTSVRLGAFQRDRYYSPATGFTVPSLWLKLLPELAENLTATLEGTFYGEYGEGRSLGKGDLREGYLQYSGDLIDIRLGRQIIVWGRADKVNPTDSLSVRDWRRLVTQDDDQRTGLLSAQVSLNFDNFRLIAVSQPEWRDPNLPIPPPPPAGVEISSTQPDNYTSQFGVKLDHTGESIDYSLSYFNGIDRVPDLSIRTLGVPLQLNLVYNPITVVGADFALNVDSWALRGEIAHTQTKDDAGTDPLVKNSSWFAVLGFDRNFGEDTNFNFQLLYRSIDQWTGTSSLDALSALLANEVQAIANQLDASQLGASARIGQKMFNQELELELSLVFWTAKSDYLARPALIYSLSDRWKIFGGVEIFGGPDQSYLGRLKPLSTGYFEMRYSF